MPFLSTDSAMKSLVHEDSCSRKGSIMKMTNTLFYTGTVLPYEKKLYCVSGRSSDFRIILRLRLPGHKTSDSLQLLSPITAAGPSRIYTGFP